MVILLILARGARRQNFAKMLINSCKFFISARGAHAGISASQNAKTLMIPCDSVDSGARSAPAEFRKKTYKSL